MKIEVAKMLVELLLEHGKQQNEFLRINQSTFEHRDFAEARTIIGKVMGSIFLDGLRPIFDDHPSLVPEGLDIGPSSSQHE